MSDPVMMPAVTIKRALVLHPVLEAVGALTPPPSPKGRYVLGKALDRAVEEKTRYENAYLTFAESVVTQTAEGKPIFTQAGSCVNFTVRPEKVAEHQTWVEDTQSELVTFTGVRQITHAELGECPITVAQEAVMVACGLLEDCEPA